jgi:hypothetical protein
VRGRSRDSPGELLVIFGDIAEDVNATPPGPGVPLVPLLVQDGDGEPVVLAGLALAWLRSVLLALRQRSSLAAARRDREVAARLGAHFARGCSVVLGCARSRSILTWAYGTSRRSGEWW